MYRGENATARASMDSFANAMMGVLESKQLERVSVKELCQRAGRSRQTFYYLFDTKEEVLEWWFVRLFEQYLARLPKDSSLDTVLFTFFSHWRSHSCFVALMVENQKMGLLVNLLEKSLVLTKPFGTLTRRTPQAEYVVSGIAGMLVGMLVKWESDNFKEDARVLSRIAGAVVTGYLVSGGVGLMQPNLSKV